MDEFSQTMLSSVDIGDASKNKFYVLSKFVLEYPRLQAAGALLPDLLQFYFTSGYTQNWHTWSPVSMQNTKVLKL